MIEKGKERLMWEVEEFVVTRLVPFEELPYSNNRESSVENQSMQSRFQLMEDWREERKYRYRKNRGEWVAFPKLTNHEICHAMFRHAFRGHSKMYIQIKDLRFDEMADSNDEKEVITLQCSLLTLQMLEYDIMMFRAMSDLEDEGYRKEAQRFYRPYLFSYVAEVNRNQYVRLRELQRKTERNSPYEEDGPLPYLWMACTFNPNISDSNIGLEGYVVQSASRIIKTKRELYIIEDEKTPSTIVNSILDGYELSGSCLKDDNSFIKAIERRLGNSRLSTIDAYKIGNGNCVYAQEENSNVGFFYDIGFNYKHRPRKIVPGVCYSYCNTMRMVYKKAPSFFILSHWDMDHVAGCVAARRDFFEKDWFAPDCYDACVDAKRLAKYLDMKEHLFLAKRRPRNRTYPGRLIGQININDTTVLSKTLATYRLYMGKKASCDSSYSNCEGIFIEYTDKINGKVVLMMGDVNYASFDKARDASMDSLFADTQIDYLIVPHHGSEHTDYKKITSSGKIPLKGKRAIICCINEKTENRPNEKHKDELKKRFGDNVITTEEALPKYNCIRINL